MYEEEYQEVEYEYPPSCEYPYYVEETPFPFVIKLGFIVMVIGFALIYLNRPAVIPAQSLTAAPGPTTVAVRVSHYWPPLGGTNCSDFRDGYCVARMTSGERWEDWIDRAIACPAELPFGTRIVVLDREWVCMDRGGSITYLDDGTFWIDMLTERALVPYGTIVEARIEP